jgi:hypothetical protein
MSHEGVKIIERLNAFFFEKFFEFVPVNTMSPPCELHHQRSLHSFSNSPQYGA